MSVSFRCDKGKSRWDVAESSSALQSFFVRS